MQLLAGEAPQPPHPSHPNFLQIAAKSGQQDVVSALLAQPSHPAMQDADVNWACCAAAQVRCSHMACLSCSPSPHCFCGYDAFTCLWC